MNERMSRNSASINPTKEAHCSSNHRIQRESNEASPLRTRQKGRRRYVETSLHCPMRLHSGTVHQRWNLPECEAKPFSSPHRLPGARNQGLEDVEDRRTGDCTNGVEAIVTRVIAFRKVECDSVRLSGNLDSYRNRVVNQSIAFELTSSVSVCPFLAP